MFSGSPRQEERVIGALKTIFVDVLEAGKNVALEKKWTEAGSLRTRMSVIDLLKSQFYIYQDALFF